MVTVPYGIVQDLIIAAKLDDLIEARRELVAIWERKKQTRIFNSRAASLAAIVCFTCCRLAYPHMGLIFT